MNNISSEIVEKWLTGWALSRELPLPVKFKSGFKVDVGYENQKTRYVFCELNDDFVRLSKSIDEPWIFLKVCASIDTVRNIVPEKWEIRPQGYMMHCFQQMNIPEISLPDDYKLEFDHYNSTYVARIISPNKEPVSVGRVILVDNLAIYDRILTEENYRRKGLATMVMKELEKIALSKGVFRNFLVATEQGKELYKAIGWKVDSYYTSLVIPKRNPLIHNE